MTEYREKICMTLILLNPPSHVSGFRRILRSKNPTRSVWFRVYLRYRHRLATE